MKYSFVYTDRQIVHFELTGDDYKSVVIALSSSEPQPYILISSGIIATKDLRFVIPVVEEESQEENEGAVPPEHESEVFLYTAKMLEEMGVENNGDE